jgi:hypothetical protein
MLSIVHSNSKISFIWFSIGKKIKKHVQIGDPIGSENRNSQPPHHSPPFARDVWRGSPPRENAKIRGLDSSRPFLTSNHPFFSRCRHAQDPPVAVLPPSPSTGSRQGADASEPLLCSLPPASDAIIVGVLKPLPSSPGTGSKRGTRARRWT